MHTARTRRSDTHAEAPRIFRIADCGERCGFLVAYLNESDFFLVGSQRLEDAVYTIARKSENRIHAPSRSGVLPRVSDTFFAMSVSPLKDRFGYYAWSEVMISRRFE